MQPCLPYDLSCGTPNALWANISNEPNTARWAVSGEHRGHRRGTLPGYVPSASGFDDDAEDALGCVAGDAKCLRCVFEREAVRDEGLRQLRSTRKHVRRFRELTSTVVGARVGPCDVTEHAHVDHGA